MMPNIARYIPIPLFLACVMPLQLVAAEASHDCAMVADPAARLACYDKAFPPTPVVNEVAAKKAVNEFGLDKQPTPLLNPGQTLEEADPEHIVSRVAKVEYNGSKRTVTLENGQVWAVAKATSSGHMVNGDAVTVRKGALGSYQIVTPSGVSIRVLRVR